MKTLAHSRVCMKQVSGETSLVTCSMEWKEESFHKEANWEVTQSSNLVGMAA